MQWDTCTASLKSNCWQVWSVFAVSLPKNPSNESAPSGGRGWTAWCRMLGCYQTLFCCQILMYRILTVGQNHTFIGIYNWWHVCLPWAHTYLHSLLFFVHMYGWPKPYIYWLIGIYSVYTVCLAGKSPYIRSHTVCIYGEYAVCLAEKPPIKQSYTVHVYGSGQP